MREFTVDEANDRLTITMSGRYSEEAQRGTRDAVEAFGRMSPGFDVVVDARNTKTCGQEAASNLAKSKEALAGLDVGSVVRVYGDSVASKIQFERVGDEEYGVHVTSSLDEAYALLDARATPTPRPTTAAIRHAE